MDKVDIVIERNSLDLVHTQLNYSQFSIVFELNAHQFVMIDVEISQSSKR